MSLSFQPSRKPFIRVLSKLKQLTLIEDGLPSNIPGQFTPPGDVPYAFGPDDVEAEERALDYFIRSGVVMGGVEDSQPLRKGYISTGGAPDDYPYERIGYVSRLNRELFDRALEQFGLIDNGIELIELASGIQGLSKPLEAVPGTKFRLHASWRISYDNAEINMEVQVRKVAYFIMKRSIIEQKTPAGLIEQSLEVTNVRAIVSRARASFRNATSNKKDFFPNERGIGYTFDGRM